MAGVATRLLPADGAAIAEAAGLLRAGEVVAMPTETVYGLAADATNAAAVDKIFRAKGRPGDNPLIVHISNLAQLEGVAAEVPAKAALLAEAFWPGPLTLVLPKAEGLPPVVSAGLATVGVRMPDHPVALALIEQTARPLAAPSANRSGRPSPTTAAHVLADMDGCVPLILDGGPTRVGIESTVLALGEKPLVLRPGAVTPEAISRVLQEPVEVSEQNFMPAPAGARPQSPGMKYRHYAPNARLVLVRGTLEAFIAYVGAHAENGVWALCFAGEEAAMPVPCLGYGAAGDAAAQAGALFAALRALDAAGAKTVYVRCPAAEGVGLAVYNRLLRAASFQIVEV